MKKFKKLLTIEMSRVKGGGTIIGRGSDEGGDYVVIDTGSSCEKRYLFPDYGFPDVH